MFLLRNVFCFRSIHVTQGPNQGYCYLAESIARNTITHVQGPNFGDFVIIIYSKALFRDPVTQFLLR